MKSKIAGSLAPDPSPTSSDSAPMTRETDNGEQVTASLNISDGMLADFVRLLREQLLCKWRSYSVPISSATCFIFIGPEFDSKSEEERNRIDAQWKNMMDNASKEQKAALLSGWLDKVALAPWACFENGFSSAIRDCVEDAFSKFIGTAALSKPKIEPILLGRLRDGIDEVSSSVARMARNAVAKHREEYARLHACYSQLVEFHPRYRSISSRTPFLEAVVELAVVVDSKECIQSEPGVWDNWRDLNDREFCVSFGRALGFLSNSYSAYNDQVEESLQSASDCMEDIFSD